MRWLKMKKETKEYDVHLVSHENKEILVADKEFLFTYDDIPKDKEFLFAYNELHNKRENVELRIPSSAETASIVYSTIEGKENFHYYLNQLVTQGRSLARGLFEYSGNLFLPKSNEEVNNGVIIDLNLKPKFYDGQLVMNKKDLVARLQNNDSSVKFVPFGFKVGEQSFFELKNNPYLIARYGDEGAEKIASFATHPKHGYFLWRKPYLEIPSSVKWEITGISGLFGGSENGPQLGIGLAGKGIRAWGQIYGVLKKVDN